MKKRLLLVLLAVSVVAAAVVLSACAQPVNNNPYNVGGKSPGGHTILSNTQLTDIAPGLGTVMVEVGYRNPIAYYAALGGNWDLAAYQIKEMGEIMEVGEVTRPNRAGGLKKFTDGPLKALNDAVTKKDPAAFKTAWDAEVKGCNDCHVDQKFPYIVWQLPKTPPEGLQLTAPSAAATTTP